VIVIASMFSSQGVAMAVRRNISQARLTLTASVLRRCVDGGGQHPSMDASLMGFAASSDASRVWLSLTTLFEIMELEQALLDL
jgi:hypothetical protein